MYAFKHAPDRIKILSVINLVLLIGMVIILPTVKLEYVPFLLIAYVVYFLANIMWLIHNPQTFRQQIWLPDIGLSKRAFHFLRHFLLPVIEILSFCAVIFFVKITVVNICLALFEGYMFFILATNIKAFFTNASVTELKTHYVYDLLALAASFMAIFALFEAKNYWQIHQILILAICFLYVTTIIALEGQRYNVKVLSKYPVVTMITVLIILVLSFLGMLSGLRTTLAITLLLYFYLSLLHNLQENLAITSSLLVEYSVLLVTAILIIISVIP